MDYDVIVVGAGPAGASAAYWLGEAGKRVLVLEKERTPRYKPCGGGVPKAVLARFPFDFSPVVEREIGRARFRFRDGREVVADLPGHPVVMVMRDRFDYHILRHARAEVREGDPVVALQQDESGVDVTTKSGETFRGRYLIGADGANSRVARLAGLRRGKRMGSTIEVEVAASDGLMAEYGDAAFFLLGAVPQGYLWIFPKAKHLSVGAGTFLGKAPGLREVLRREMGRLGIEMEGAPWRGHPLPVYLRHEVLHRGRIVLTGDAAGLVDPLLGEGVRHAVESGQMAAEAVLTDDPAGYTRQVHRGIGNDLRWGLRWARLFYNHPWICFELGVRNPRFLEEFPRLFAGQTTYRAMALRAPLNLLIGLWQRRPATSNKQQSNGR
ncbi:MAG TPA: NAD(P)/FAD-dependent oxidoreductase [Anaerolineales bacterium]|nr:NAD(P)/FAD-dependent oxidoreductase [Anaerolineae bacterium]HIQ01595.1 NAD(P)/FAD-dependent oxidoreductase [Anaerolineales bacterium]